MSKGLNFLIWRTQIMVNNSIQSCNCRYPSQVFSILDHYTSGNWYFGYGDKFDKTKLKMLPPGSVYSEVAGQNHFAMTKDPVIVEITGYGPSGVTYVNPLDDPEHSKK